MKKELKMKNTKLNSMIMIPITFESPSGQTKECKIPLGMLRAINFDALNPSFILVRGQWISAFSNGYFILGNGQAVDMLDLSEIKQKDGSN